MPLELFTIPDMSVDWVQSQVKEKDWLNLVNYKKVKQWTNSSIFKANPIQFLYDWRQKHPKADLRSYSRLYFNDYGHRPEKERAFESLTFTIMSHQEFIPAFINWAKMHSDEFVQEEYNETPPETLERVKQAFKQTIDSNTFETDLKGLRDVIIGAKGAMLKNTRSLKWIIKPLQMETKNLEAVLLQRVMRAFLNQYFDFAFPISTYVDRPWDTWFIEDVRTNKNTQKEFMDIIPAGLLKD